MRAWKTSIMRAESARRRKNYGINGFAVNVKFALKVGGEVRDQDNPGTFLNDALGSNIYKKKHFGG